jgi:hypothetical protein
MQVLKDSYQWILSLKILLLWILGVTLLELTPNTHAEYEMNKIATYSYVAILSKIY